MWGLVPGERGEAAHPANSVFLRKRLLLVKSCVCGEDVFRHTGVPGEARAAPSPKDGGKPTLNSLMLLQLLPN